MTQTLTQWKNGAIFLYHFNWIQETLIVFCHSAWNHWQNLHHTNYLSKTKKKWKKERKENGSLNCLNEILLLRYIKWQTEENKTHTDLFFPFQFTSLFSKKKHTYLYCIVKTIIWNWIRMINGLVIKNRVVCIKWIESTIKWLHITDNRDFW